MIDLNQASYALRNTAGPRTLIILDEFGKGTLATGLSAFFSLCLTANSSMFSLAPIRPVRMEKLQYTVRMRPQTGPVSSLASSSTY